MVVDSAAPVTHLEAALRRSDVLRSVGGVLAGEAERGAELEPRSPPAVDSEAELGGRGRGGDGSAAWLRPCGGLACPPGGGERVSHAGGERPR